MIVLGIDPALIKTGYGIVSMKDNNISYITSGTIITNTKLPIEERLKNIFVNINHLIETYKPDYFSIEETFSTLFRTVS